MRESWESETLHNDRHVIQVQDLRKSFKDTDVLKGVGFKVGRSEIFALLGSNGAGKTTTVNILSLLLGSDGGAASICGFDVTRQSKKHSVPAAARPLP